MINLILVHKDSGIPVEPGEIVKDFRGDEAEFCHADPPRTPNSTGRAYVKQLDGNGDTPFGFYPSVFGLEWRELED